MVATSSYKAEKDLYITCPVCRAPLVWTVRTDCHSMERRRLRCDQCGSNIYRHFPRVVPDRQRS